MKEMHNYTEAKNPLKSEHLKEGVNPIIACIGTREQFKQDKEFDVYLKMTSNQSERQNVDYYGDPIELANQNFKNAGAYTYTISPVDNLDKFSEHFKNCTGLVVAGQDKKTGENISFASHQDPYYFLRERNKNVFMKDLKDQLEELKKRSKEGTIDAVIVGGNYLDPDARYNYQRDYLASIKLLSEETRQILGFEPVVMTGPKIVSGGDNIFYANGSRRLYIIRPEVGDRSSESFIHSDISAQERRWRGENRG